jgi:hypothetical protein
MLHGAFVYFARIDGYEKECCPCDSKSNSPVKNKTITTEASNRATLLKHYMDCLVEI